MPETIMIEPEPTVASQLFGDRIEVVRETPHSWGTAAKSWGSSVRSSHLDCGLDTSSTPYS
jgi:hypothetical protein